MAVAKDYYELLGVERGATADAIRRAYRTLARKYHPDVNKSTDAATRFSEIQEAYDVLSDAGKRKAYDRFGAAGVGVGSRQVVPSRSIAQQIINSRLAVATTAIFRRVLLPRHTLSKIARRCWL